MVLVAVDRAELGAKNFIEAARQKGEPLRTTAPVVAQVWRDGSRQALTLRRPTSTNRRRCGHRDPVAAPPRQPTAGTFRRATTSQREHSLALVGELPQFLVGFDVGRDAAVDFFGVQRVIVRRESYQLRC